MVRSSSENVPLLNAWRDSLLSRQIHTYIYLSSQFFCSLNIFCFPLVFRSPVIVPVCLDVLNEVMIINNNILKYLIYLIHISIAIFIRCFKPCFDTLYFSIIDNTWSYTFLEERNIFYCFLNAFFELF
jgi:hypothetical protein